MKKLFIVFTFLIVGMISNAQNKNTPSKQVDKGIVDKMKDSLGLTNKQIEKVEKINEDLNKEKEKARKKSSDRSVVGKELQRIENRRDILYKGILTEKQFSDYKQKKRNIVSAKNL